MTANMVFPPETRARSVYSRTLRSEVSAAMSPKRPFDFACHALAVRRRSARSRSGSTATMSSGKPPCGGGDWQHASKPVAATSRVTMRVRGTGRRTIAATLRFPRNAASRAGLRAGSP